MNAKRKPLIVGNWKMNKTQAETRAFAEGLSPSTLPAGVEVGIAPPYLSLAAAVEALRGRAVDVYAQSVHWEDSGAFTGEISAGMLREIGVAGALIGHSERRQYFGETDDTVNRRLRAALRHDLRPIVCVGELLAQRKAGEALPVIERQLNAGLAQLGASEAVRIVIAYEPVWAIGTGETASPEQAQEVHAIIREQLGKLFGPDCASGVRILYGGSVTPDNAATLLGQSDVDGALVGGASLSPEKFAKLLNFQ